MDEFDIGLAEDAGEVMALAELEARRQGAQEVGPAHLALALARHRVSAAAFRAIELGQERLRPILAGDRPAGYLPPSMELIQLLAQAQARALVHSKADSSVRSGHLAYALLKSDHPVSRAIGEAAGLVAASDGRTPPQDAVLERIEHLCLTGESEVQASRFRRLLHGAAWIGRLSLFAFAWSTLWVIALAFGVTWVAGTRFYDQWFRTILFGGGVASIFSIAIHGIISGLREDARNRRRRAAAAELLARAERVTGQDMPVAPP